MLALAAVFGTVIAAGVPATIILNSRDYYLMRFLSRIPMEVYAILWGGVFVAAAVAGFMVRDVAMRGLVRRHISAMNCIDCGYSLMGLGPYKDPRGIDVVKCPECGVENDLRSRGATVEEFAVLAAGGEPPRGPDAPEAGRR